MFSLSPIGFVESHLKERYEAPHQGVFGGDTNSVIRLERNRNYEQALKDLEGFDRIWVIYLFHLNDSWKPLVTPPRNDSKKVGVFASRSPHRPNGIGLSCVTLDRIDGLNIYISNSDILDGSPVLDIKPYLPWSDSFPESKTGWAKTGDRIVYKVEFSADALSICNRIFEEDGVNLAGYARVQLAFDPSDTSRKRVDPVSANEFGLTYRNWQIIYTIDESKSSVMITNIIIRG
ncbi:MAG: tRNA (N6-threonylcarbamoyladenosine(37)-N6)-methyltransferase TrmO [Ignavibacteriales bacterium]|nr:tRNA (N6-threonylcarbamoyladenosine(37)-N6)-methyltransferase TrmO [Ignavibacteriales bacterium]